MVVILPCFPFKVTINNIGIDGQINQLLGASGLPMEGTVDDKKDRFRNYIGLSIVA